MFGNHHCSLCGKALPYKGICYECQPVPKEEKMATDFRTKICGQCGYFWSDSYTGAHCRRTGLKMTSDEIPACPSFVAAQEDK